MLEARELENRFDIFGDVDRDGPGGVTRFDTGLGEDLRVPMFELKGIDPFKARLLLGMNNGEFADLHNWQEQIVAPAWYDAIFAPIESAPSVEAIGRANLEAIARDAKRHLLAGGATDGTGNGDYHGDDNADWRCHYIRCDLQILAPLHPGSTPREANAPFATFCSMTAKKKRQGGLGRAALSLGLRAPYLVR